MRAQKCEWNDHKFDSRAEMGRAKALTLLQSAGEITDLEFHKKFVIQPRIVLRGRIYSQITYECDSCYWEERDGKLLFIIEDVKHIKGYFKNGRPQYHNKKFGRTEALFIGSHLEKLQDNWRFEIVDAAHV